MRQVAAATATLLLSCGSEAAGVDAPRRTSCEAVTEPSIVLHQGRAPYAPLEAGDVVDIEFGTQGGMHVLLSVSCAGLDAGSPTLEQGLQNDDLPRVTWSVAVPTDVLSSETPRRAVRQEDVGDRVLLEPQLVVLRYFESPPSAFDAAERQSELEALPATIEAAVTDRCDRSASASIEASLRFPRDGG